MNKFTKQVFNSNGTWTCPAGVTEILVYGMGGGSGGGAGIDGTTYGVGDGGAGGTGTCLQPVLLEVIPNTSYSITIGAGGEGGTYSTGGSGGNTSFGSIMTWEGAGSWFSLMGNLEESGSSSFYSTSGGTLPNMNTYPSGGKGESYSPSEYGYAGYTGLLANKGANSVSNAGRGGGSGMSGEAAGGVGGSGVANQPGQAGGDAPANSGAGGGGGAGGATSKARGLGGAGGSGQIIIMWVE